MLRLWAGRPNLSNRRFPYQLKEEFDGPPEKVLAELAMHWCQGREGDLRRCDRRRQLFSTRALPERVGN